jgi:hypothetical protein
MCTLAMSLEKMAPRILIVRRVELLLLNAEDMQYFQIPYAMAVADRVQVNYMDAGVKTV